MNDLYSVKRFSIYLSISTFYNFTYTYPYPKLSKSVSTCFSFSSLFVDIEDDVQDLSFPIIYVGWNYLLPDSELVH